MMRRSIRDKQLAVRKSSVRIDERVRHLNMDVCSDTMLAESVPHHTTQATRSAATAEFIGFWARRDSIERNSYGNMAGLLVHDVPNGTNFNDLE